MSTCPHSTLIFFQVSLGKKNTYTDDHVNPTPICNNCGSHRGRPVGVNFPTGASFCCCCFPRRGSHSYKDKPKGMSLEMESQLRVPLENFCWLVTFCFGELRDGMEVD